MLLAILSSYDDSGKVYISYEKDTATYTKEDD